eukprot:jgi/Tetstr1/458154/TSEL_044645.t1
MYKISQQCRQNSAKADGPRVSPAASKADPPRELREMADADDLEKDIMGDDEDFDDDDLYGDVGGGEEEEEEEGAEAGEGGVAGGAGAAAAAVAGGAAAEEDVDIYGDADAPLEPDGGGTKPEDGAPQGSGAGAERAAGQGDGAKGPGQVGLEGHGPSGGMMAGQPGAAHLGLPVVGSAIYIGNLQWWTTDADLEIACSEYGKVVNIRFQEEKTNGKSKGSAIVDFMEPEAAVPCRDGLHARVINGRNAAVTLHREGGPGRNMGGGPGPRGPAPGGAPHPGRGGQWGGGGGGGGGNRSGGGGRRDRPRAGMGNPGRGMPGMPGMPGMMGGFNPAMMNPAMMAGMMGMSGMMGMGGGMGGGMPSFAPPPPPPSGRRDGGDSKGERSDRHKRRRD